MCDLLARFEGGLPSLKISWATNDELTLGLRSRRPYSNYRAWSGYPFVGIGLLSYCMSLRAKTLLGLEHS